LETKFRHQITKQNKNKPLAKGYLDTGVQSALIKSVYRPRPYHTRQFTKTPSTPRDTHRRLKPTEWSGNNPQQYRALMIVHLKPNRHCKRYGGGELNRACPVPSKNYEICARTQRRDGFVGSSHMDNHWNITRMKVMVDRPINRQHSSCVSGHCSRLCEVRVKKVGTVSTFLGSAEDFVLFPYHRWFISSF